MTRWLDAVTFGPQRRARRMMRQLRELDAQDARLKAAGLDPLDEWLRGRDPRLAPAGAPLQPAARSPRRAALLAVVLTVAIGGLVAWHQYHGGPADARVRSRDPPTCRRPGSRSRRSTRRSPPRRVRQDPLSPGRLRTVP